MIYGEYGSDFDYYDEYGNEVELSDASDTPRDQTNRNLLNNQQPS